MTTPKRDLMADVFDLAGALIQAVVVGGGALLIVLGLAMWIADLLGLS